MESITINNNFNSSIIINKLENKLKYINYSITTGEKIKVEIYNDIMNELTELIINHNIIIDKWHDKNYYSNLDTFNNMISDFNEKAKIFDKNNFIQINKKYN